MFNPLIKSLADNLGRPLGELLLEKTTRSEDKPLLDPPVDLQGRRMCAPARPPFSLAAYCEALTVRSAMCRYGGLTFVLQDDEMNPVTTSDVFLKFVEFKFVPVRASNARPIPAPGSPGSRWRSSRSECRS